ncbi:MAG: S24 family peptidase [Patescibacteria group bacterium]|jgi:repressor LexA
MNETQEKLLKLAKKKDISDMKFREIMREIGVKHPQSVIYNLEQLKKKGLLYFDSNKRQRVAKPQGYTVDNFFNIPIVGSASCGPATELAETHIEGYLKISKKSIGQYRPDGLIAVRAVGDSMTGANIKGEGIETGDYVVVECKQKPSNGNYVLSVIDGAANIKKFFKDNTKHEIRLISETDNDAPPITIHEEDVEDGKYFVNGVVVRVVKK